MGTWLSRLAERVADVFISYSKSRQKETADLAADLEGRGFTVWWDKDITPGEIFRDTIMAELAAARAAIVIWTPASAKSNWVISEASRAQRRGILISVHSADLKAHDIPAPFDVAHVELVDNRPAIFAALEKMGVTPSASPTARPAVDRPREENKKPWQKVLSSRRALLVGGGALSAGALATAIYYSQKGSSGSDRPLHTLTSPDLLYVSSVAYTLDGRDVISGSWDQRLRLWDPVSEKELRRFEAHEGPVWAVAALPDGNRALSAGADRTLKLWDLSNSHVIRDFKGHEDEVWSLAILPGANQVLSASKDTTLKLWDVATARATRTFSVGAKIRSVAVAAGGQVAVLAAGDALESWDLSGGTKIRTFEGHQGEVNGVAITPNGLSVLSAGDDGTIRSWELSSGRALHTMSGHSGRVLAVAVAPNGRTVLSGGSDGTVMLWDLSAGRPRRTLEGHTDSVDAVAIAPDGRTAVTGSRNKTLNLWDWGGAGSGR